MKKTFILILILLSISFIFSLARAIPETKKEYKESKNFDISKLNARNNQWQSAKNFKKKKKKNTKYLK